MSGVLFWIAVGIVVWFGLRHLFSILIGYSQEGPLKPGQRWCQATSMIILWAACIVAIYIRSWLPLLIGVTLEFIYRHFVRWTGQRYMPEKENKLLNLENELK